MSATASSLSPITLSLRARLESRLLTLCSSIAETCSGKSLISRELDQKYSAAVADIHHVRIESFDESFGAFLVKDGVLFIREEPIAHLLNAVMFDVRHQSEFFSKRPL
jgi:hypothetical protein